MSVTGLPLRGDAAGRENQAAVVTVDKHLRPGAEKS